MVRSLMKRANWRLSLGLANARAEIKPLRTGDFWGHACEAESKALGLGVEAFSHGFRVAVTVERPSSLSYVYIGS
jgi:hypothetical protein